MERALLGILFRVFWINAPRWLYVALYLLLGWAAVMYIVDLLNANVAMMVLVIVGGLLYTGGAIVYALKKPNPWPGHFGFHEIFHVCTVLAFLCHWTACLLIALEPLSPRSAPRDAAVRRQPPSGRPSSLASSGAAVDASSASGPACAACAACSASSSSRTLRDTARGGCGGSCPR